MASGAPPGCYLLLVLGQPCAQEHKDHILKKVEEEFSDWIRKWLQNVTLNENGEFNVKVSQGHCEGELSGLKNIPARKIMRCITDVI
ncbi:hypothetical protein AVEN_46342-1 [Araneus ventricosus]|uniref:Uncharacterized protein n=1 Tax=Araneus ventricosus TaxID=182803 RepID=A0A4Y2KUB0_ARAVE|nr:hypothetical protein AVEN_46342-1 [Araneus ventricosus]